MILFRASFFKMGASALVLSAALGAASAQDATAVAERLKATLAQQGTVIGWTRSAIRRPGRA